MRRPIAAATLNSGDRGVMSIKLGCERTRAAAAWGPGWSQLVCGSRPAQTYTRKKPSPIGLATRAGTGFTTSLLMSGQITLEISSGRDFL
jgi:hypothetical protein